MAAAAVAGRKAAAASKALDTGSPQGSIGVRSVGARRPAGGPAAAGRSNYIKGARFLLYACCLKTHGLSFYYVMFTVFILAVVLRFTIQISF